MLRSFHRSQILKRLFYFISKRKEHGEALKVVEDANNRQCRDYRKSYTTTLSMDWLNKFTV